MTTTTGGGGGDGSDLFAGLSLALSSSNSIGGGGSSPVTKKKNGPSSIVTNGGAVVVDGSSPTPTTKQSPIAAMTAGGGGGSPMAVSPQQQPAPTGPPVRVQSAPITDKLLGLLSGGENNIGSNSTISNSNTMTQTMPGNSSLSVVVRPPLTPRTQKSEDTRQVLSAFSMESKDGVVVTVSPSKATAGTTATTSVGPSSSLSSTSSPLERHRRLPPPPPLTTLEGGEENYTTNTTTKQQQQHRTPTPQQKQQQHKLRGVGVIKADTPIQNGDVALRLIRKFVTKTRRTVPETHGGAQPLSFWNRYVYGTPPEYGTRFDAYLQLVQITSHKTTKTDGEGSSVDRANPIRPSAPPPPSMDGTSDSAITNNVDAIVDAVLGESGDTMAKAREAVASFCHLMSVWAHVSARMGEAERVGGRTSTTTTADVQTFRTMVATGYDVATALVTHGCLDGVMIGIGPSNDEYHRVVEVLAESIFSTFSDVSQSPECELSAMKFLLSTGCRINTQDGHAMLRGGHLLQTIRVLYHVYLSTTTEANKTTARASLQQLVTSVFIRMIASTTTTSTTPPGAIAYATTTTPSTLTSLDSTSQDDNGNNNINNHYHGGDRPDGVAAASEEEGGLNPTQRRAGEEEPDFPSSNHRDAFLVLRSLCKLSMRNPPSSSSHSSYGGGGTATTVAIQASSSPMWDASRDHPIGNSSGGGGGSSARMGSNGSGGNNNTNKVSAIIGSVGDEKQYGGGGSGDKHVTTRENGPQHVVHASTNHNGIHPALESKILALELLLYVLNTTNMRGSTTFLRDCGPQFHYAVRNYLCVSLLKNCTSDDTRVVNLSLRVFVPIFQIFRSILKTEIEAFVTNVFFVILDSKNSPIEHKSLVVTLFDEICSDPTTLAEIFLNYDCDLSAVDLFHRIVNTLSKVARTTDVETSTGSAMTSTMSLVAGSGAAKMEKMRSAHRELRLHAMRALRQVLASLHASIVEPMASTGGSGTGGGTGNTPTGITASVDEKHNREGQGNDMTDNNKGDNDKTTSVSSGKKKKESDPSVGVVSNGNDNDTKQSLVQIYDSKKRRREEESEIILRFNQKPKAGIAYASKCGHIDGSDPTDVARYLLKNKDRFEKTMIGDFLGREPEYEQGFSLKVLHAYVNSMDFEGLTFDDAIRYYLSGFRLPGEAQKIDRIMEKFAERYTEQNPEAFATADVAFILSFSIIMLNTDLHNPAIKEERRMTKEGFIRNNRGISDGQDLPPEMLTDIFDRIKENPISLKEDDDARERAGDIAASNALSPAVFFSSHYDEMEKTKESNFNKERDQIVRTTESLLKRRRHSTLETGKGGNRRNRAASIGSKNQHVRYVRTEDSGLRDEYVAPMFEVTWGPALAAFSTAMESANGTVGALLAIATDEELEAAAVNAAETIEVCLTGFRFAIGTAGLVGNDTARDAYMLALSRFSQLGTGTLLEPRHVRCVQTMLALARSDGELLGSSWEHIFRALSEINRFHQLFQLMARNDRAVAAAAQRRRTRLAERERRQDERERRKAAKESSDSIDDMSIGSIDASSDTDLSYGDASSLFDDLDEFNYNDEMDTKEIDEANARTIYEAVSEEMIEAIYERSSSMSTSSVKEFILQLCRVSRMEISNYGGHVGSESNEIDLTKVQYRKHHELIVQTSSRESKDGFHHHQTNIYNLQKLVEVTHYNMDSRPRLVFAELWMTVSAHLTSTALHSNPAVAMYAVDSFRQLCIQYLQREELGVFEFQRRFLKPLETVMAKSQISITKELLLKCVERIILMFGSPKEGSKGGMLRSGWRPVLAVLGLAGRDSDEHIAKMGFDLLVAQIQECLDQCSKNGDDSNHQGVLLIERFVDLVDALLVYVAGPHEEMSLRCIDSLLKLCEFLADESTISPLVKKRRNVASHEIEESEDEGNSSNQELELWWPILLGMSRSVGDPRKAVRRKSLESMFKVVSTHFFPPVGQKSVDETSRTKKLQTLQLVFRGILSPVLEFGDVDPNEARVPELPNDFERFLTAPKTGQEMTRPTPSKAAPSWLDTTYDPFMDGCIQICMRSIDVFRQDTLIEEIFAMFNSCLISDSGAMGVKGLRRLEQFVCSDLRPSSITDDTWATVSHMLRRCLSVRGLPKKSVSGSLNGSSASISSLDGKSKDDLAGVENEEHSPAYDEQESIREFVAEDAMFFDRRYVGSNTVAVIGKLLEGERFSKSLGLRWRLFLVSGLGKTIRDWEYAASIISKHGSKGKVHRVQAPPSYRETAYYGRKWMNRFLLQIASLKEVEGTAAEGSRQAAAQTLVKEQTQALVSALLDKEAIVAGDGKKTALDAKLFERLMILVHDMLAGYSKLPNEHLSKMSWLNPVLSSCIHTSNEEIRLSIQRLVKRLH